MHEIVVNLHMHTRYSDGNASHAEIAQDALKTGLDAVIVTDHNVLVTGPEDYYFSENGASDRRRVLLLVGEEIHDQARDPQKNHLLVFGANRDLATLAHDLKRLLDGVRHAGGLAFIAHPNDPAAPLFNETDITWVDWNLQGFTGIELWNTMSEFKSRLKSRLHALYYALNPMQFAEGPFPETLTKWDELLAQGRRVVAIGGSDAHAFDSRMGPLRRTIFPYEFLFKMVNTHLLIPRPLSGDIAGDRQLIFDAFKNGRGFVGYDLPASTRGFRFTAQGNETTAWMGEEISTRGGVTLQIRLPRPTECRLIKDGKVLHAWDKRPTFIHITSEPGVYRVEAYLDFMGKRRGWIFSNPIYLR